MKKLLFLFLLLSNTCFAASTATVFDTDTKLMMHMKGADAATTFIDSSTGAKTVTANGNAQIDTAQYKFGGSSALFDGTGDFLSLADSADWDFGSGDFTMDFRVRFNELPAVGSRAALISQNVDANNTCSLYLYRANENTFYWYFILNKDGVNLINVLTPATVTAATWYHFALSREGNNFRIFQNGTQMGSTVVDSDSFVDFPVPLQIGEENGVYDFKGWMDELRITKGTALWTANFTAPSNEYQNPTNFFQIMGA